MSKIILQIYRNLIHSNRNYETHFIKETSKEKKKRERKKNKRAGQPDRPAQGPSRPTSPTGSHDRSARSGIDGSRNL